jgi:predicted transcriptional regulator
MSDEKDNTSMLALHRQWQWINYRLMETGGEMDDQLEAFFSELTEKFAEKVDAYQYIITRLEKEEAALKDEASKYNAAARAMKTARERMKATIKYVMESRGVTEIFGEKTRMVLSRTKDALDIDESQIPAAFKKQIMTYEIDRERIRAELEKGNEVPGARLVPGFALRSYVGGKK